MCGVRPLQFYANDWEILLDLVGDVIRNLNGNLLLPLERAYTSTRQPEQALVLLAPSELDMASPSPQLEEKLR